MRFNTVFASEFWEGITQQNPLSSLSQKCDGLIMTSSFVLQGSRKMHSTGKSLRRPIWKVAFVGTAVPWSPGPSKKRLPWTGTTDNDSSIFQEYVKKSSAALSSVPGVLQFTKKNRILGWKANKELVFRKHPKNFLRITPLLYVSLVRTSGTVANFGLAVIFSYKSLCSGHESTSLTKEVKKSGCALKNYED